MKKISAFISFILVILFALQCLSGCGNNTAPGDAADTGVSRDSAQTDGGEKKEDGDEDKEEKKEEKKKKDADLISIDDIDWSVDEGILDGERFIMMEYTNNSEYTVTGLEISFREKSGITEEERNSYFDGLKELMEIDENDPDDVEDFEELKGKEITMYARSGVLTLPGESSVPVELRYYNGRNRVRDIEHFELTEPDIATVKYIDNSQVLCVYYDFASGKYSKDKKTENACYWTEKALENAVPKPEAPCIKDGGIDKDDMFSFDVYGWTLEDFNAYVKQCIDAGYTVDPLEHEGFYCADSADGYNIYLYYDDNEFSMSGTVKIAEPEET